MEIFNPININFTKYLFFTGKGGVGKTSAACATAVTLADMGKKVLLISTDPASNLQDVFDTLVINGLFTEYDDEISKSYYIKQQRALSEMPMGLKNITTYVIPLRAYNITGIENVRAFLTEEKFNINEEKLNTEF